MITGIVSRLNSQVADLKHVASASEFSEVLDNPPQRNQVPAAYVVPLAERAEANTLVRAVSQRVTVNFGVILFIGNLGKKVTGEKAMIAMKALKDAVSDVLIGYTPTGYDDIITAAGGRLLGARDGLVIWRSDFRTIEIIRKV